MAEWKSNAPVPDHEAAKVKAANAPPVTAPKQVPEPPEGTGALAFVMERIALTFTAIGTPRFDDKTIDAARLELESLRAKAKLAEEFADCLAGLREDGDWNTATDTDRGYGIVGMESEDAKDWLRRYDEVVKLG